MKQRRSSSESGIRIENTLSMALQRRSSRRNYPELLLIAALGVMSCFFTFETMFSPVCDLPLVLLFGTGVMVFLSWHALHTESKHISLLLFMAVFGGFFFHKRMELAAGLSNILNAVCQTIYRTDWEYFHVSSDHSEVSSTTLVICFVLVPIIWLTVYAVVRYRNFFLSFLITFPFAEIGLFFGIEPKHIPAAALFSFWCGMAAVQLAEGSGPIRNTAGFVRRKNAFYPVSGMRFLVTEYAGCTAVILSFCICMLVEGALHVFPYERPEKVKQMRTDFQYYASDIDWSDLSTVFPFLSSRSGFSRDEVLHLGRVDKKTSEKAELSAVSFSAKPSGMIYLKYRTFHRYDKSSWKMLDSSVYEAEIFDTMQQVNCYPAEFLGLTMRSFLDEDIEMTLSGTDDILSECVPYTFKADAKITCSPDDSFDTKTKTYTIIGDQDLEAALQHMTMAHFTSEELLDRLPDAQKEVLQPPDPHVLSAPVTLPDGVPGEKAAEAAILCKDGYTDLVREQYLTIPDTEDARHIYAAYADILDNVPKTMEPAEIIQVLQALRERMCENVTYSLAPGKTPPNEDFAAYFLLDHKMGYCMHYATAGVLLARMAGIPARYCEGYVIDSEELTRSDENGVVSYSTAVRDNDAHAWAEIYIEGFGWIPFEFTYTYFEQPATEPETGSLTETNATETETEMPALSTEVQTDPESTEATESTNAVSGMASAPVSSGTHTVSAHAAATEASTERYTEEQVQPGKIHLVLLVLGSMVCVIAVIAGFVIARNAALRKRRQLLYQKNIRKVAETLWKHLLDLLRECGANTCTGTSAALQEEAEKHCAAFMDTDLLTQALQAGTKLRYSPYDPTQNELKLLHSACQLLSEGLYGAASPAKKFIYKWLRHYL